MPAGSFGSLHATFAGGTGAAAVLTSLKSSLHDGSGHGPCDFAVACRDRVGSVPRQPCKMRVIGATAGGRCGHAAEVFAKNCMCGTRPIGRV